MSISHEMPPAAQVLQCVECHEATDRMDFSALGYDPVEDAQWGAFVHFVP